MTILESLTQTPLAQALGLTLLHSLWEGAVVAAALVIAVSVTRCARARYLSACIAMLAVVAAFIVTLTHFLPEASIGGGAIRLPPRTIYAASTAATALSERIDRSEVLPWLAPLWFTGVLLFHLQGLASWFGAHRLRSRGVCSAPDVWSLRLERIRVNISLSKPVALLESCFTPVPVVIGFLRPVILLPAGMLAGMPVSQVEAILLHELAHIRRHDYLANLLQTVIENFLFYHPAIWWISHVIRTERENCCDDFVVATRRNTRDYVTALASLEQRRWTANQTALAATGGSLVKRIHRLLDPGRRSRAALTPVLSAALLLAGAAMGTKAWQVNVPAPAEPTASPFIKWLNEDAAYIVTDAERFTFAGLNSDEERERFVEQFWERRDPTPGTPQNEYKTEHYRRIAYTNRHFSTGIPGWKTDRGRIYITLGPPDEIDSHPAGGTYTRPLAQGGADVLTYPFEQWRYRFVQGLGANVAFEFVDTDRTGQYRLTTNPSEKIYTFDAPVEGKRK